MMFIFELFFIQIIQLYPHFGYGPVGWAVEYTDCIYIQCITKVSTPLTFLQVFKYISSWDNTDKITIWHNEK